MAFYTKIAGNFTNMSEVERTILKFGDKIDSKVIVLPRSPAYRHTVR